MTSRSRQLLAIPAAGAVIAAVVAVAILPRVGGQGLVSGTSSTPSVERSTESASPDARPTRSVDHTPGVSPNPTRTTEFEFVRFRGDVTIMSEPGGGEGIETTWEGLIAPVIGRADVDGEGWIGVQFGSFGVHHRILFGWVPAEADLRGGDSSVRGRTYEPVTVECRGQHPDVEEILRLLPAQALACYGSNTLTFTPVLIRDDPDEERLLIDGEPEWLAVASDHAMYAFGPDGWTECGSMRVHVDPASGLSPPDDLWVELDGHFDHPASADCTRSSEYPEMGIGGPREMVLWCRERFVITGIRELDQGEHPRPTPFYTPGPPARGSVEVDLRRIRAPFPGRSASASVWTGTEMIAWGGYTLVDGFGEPGGELTRPTDGVAYDPVRDTWRRIPDAPIEPRDRPMSA